MKMIIDYPQNSVQKILCIILISTAITIFTPELDCLFYKQLIVE